MARYCAIMGVCDEKSDFSRTGTADLSFCGNKLNLLINALKGFRDRNPFFLAERGHSDTREPPLRTVGCADPPSKSPSIGLKRPNAGGRHLLSIQRDPKYRRHGC